MRYEIATLTIRLGAAAKVTAGIDRYMKSEGAKGALLGCWATEIGELNQILVLRGFADLEALQAERWRMLNTADPFGGGESIVDINFESYAPFPFVGAVTPGKYGAVYEIRTYQLKHGGLSPTMAAWEEAMKDRGKISPLTLAMYALDGPPRFTHIWPFASLDARAEARSRAVTTGVWPPKGGPDWLTGQMRSIVGLPTAISPLS